jgi:hypothetical protein
MPVSMQKIYAASYRHNVILKFCTNMLQRKTRCECTASFYTVICDNAVRFKAILSRSLVSDKS